MDIPDPTYITVEAVRSQTLVTGLKTEESISTDDLTILIQTAEDQIDSYVRKQPHHPLDSNINRIFPREQDFSRVGTSRGIVEYPDTPEIPLDISIACLRQVEFLYLQWWSNRATAEMPANYALESQDIGGDGSYSETRARGGTDFSEATLCDQAKAKLNGYVSRFAPISTTDVRTSVPARQDAGF